MKLLIKIFFLCLLFLSSVFTRGVTQTGPPRYSAYLFAYFTGNSGDEEAVRFAISRDGFNYRALNANQPVLDPKAISSTGGVRDPHILRGEDGKTFYMVLTDMVSARGWDSNRALVLLKSGNLIDWESTVVNIQETYPGQEDLLRVWAPQTIFDAEAGKYMVYWSMKHGDGPDIIYYAYANADFTGFEDAPKPLFLPENRRSCIDGDIVIKDGVYHLFYKTEGHGNGIKVATTTSLTSGNWTEQPDYKQQTTEAVEGSCTFRLIDSDTYILMYDVYMKGRYQFTKSTDLQHFEVIDQQVSMDFKPRHGTVIPITEKELQRLMERWGTPTTRRNPVLKGSYADPEILYSRKTEKFYIYPTSDGFDHWGGYYFKAFSSTDLVNWKDEGVILDLKKDVPWAGRNAWAPCIEEKEIDGVYRYFYYFTGAQKIGVAVADSPTGPFRDTGKPLIDFKPAEVDGGQEIDPDVFTDPVSGKSFLYWGNGYLAVAELNEDMVSIKRETIRVITPDRTYREGAYVIFRNGTYYFLWSEDDTRSPDYRVRYGTSDSPLGPIQVPGDNLILAKDTARGIYGTGHNSVLQLPGTDEWYIVYHRFRYPDGIHMGDAAGYNREVCMDRLAFDAEGRILPVKPSHEGVKLPHNMDGNAARLFPLRDVRLLDGPFKQAQDRNLEYLMALDMDRLLAPFLREAGLEPKAASYGNWENSGLDGHVGGHYLTALSLMYAASGDSAVKRRLDYMIAELKRCQDHVGTGYIGGVPGGAALWEEIRSGKIEAGAFDLNKKWVPLYNIHKTFAGLRDAYLIGGCAEARSMLVRLSDWMLELTGGLSDAQVQDMLRSEHGGLNEVFADVAAITGDDRYLQLAKRFSHRTILDPLLKGQDRLTGLHANTQIPKVIGYNRIADIEGNPSWHDAARFFWETVVGNRSVVIGGNSAHEHFHPANDFTRMIRSVEGPETCNTYNMLKLTEQLFQAAPDVRYADYYERALYNHILSTQHPETGGLVYFTPMRPGHYRVYSQPHTSFWCCVGSGMENHGKYGQFIYTHKDENLYVNLFIASRLDWKEKRVELVQQTRFPDQAGTVITVTPEQSTTFTLQLRYPGWVPEGELEISVNGKPYPVSQRPGTFVPIRREWQAGDRVEVSFAMHTAVEQLPDSSNYYAFRYGPIVLAARTDTTSMDGLFADDSRGGHIAHGPQVPLRDIPVVVGRPETLTASLRPVKGKPLHFTMNRVYAPSFRGKMELMPFFRLHDSRYILYWPQATREEVTALQRRMEAEERESRVLEERTVDHVYAGQQQPESDHAVAFEASVTGQYEGMQWREAKGWFSYRFINPEGTARALFIRYLNMDRPSVFDVLVNGQVLTTIRLDGRDGGNDPLCATYPLPDELTDNGQLTVEFRAHDGSYTARLTEVRILREF